MKTIKPGIRQKENGKYLATKSINKKRYYKETDTLREAVKWKQNFVPLTNPEALSEIVIDEKINGRNREITMREAFNRFKDEHISTLAEQWAAQYSARLENFLVSMMSMRVCKITPDVIEAVVNEKKALKVQTTRYNFDKDLKFTRQFFDWYKNNIDPVFEIPIRDYHFIFGKIKKVVKKQKHISKEELLKFLEKLSGVYQDLAYFQLYMGARIQEAAGLRKDKIDLENRVIEISSVVNWIDGKVKAKDTTKTSATTYAYVNNHMIEIIERNNKSNSPYLFTINDSPLGYHSILRKYNQAMKEANLPYSGTHILRYGMAKFAGEISGDEGAKAVTRHESMRMAQKYRGKDKVIEITDLNKELVIGAENFFRVGASSCVHEEAKEAKVIEFKRVIE